MSVITDSRKAEEGCLFVPIVGERVDAHKFIPQVMEAGALATLSERVLDNADFPYIAVESSLQAVKDIAEFYLKQLQIPVVGITGSVGKTSTKEVIGSSASRSRKVLPTALSWTMAEPAKQAAALMTPITENTNKHILRL